MSMIIGTYVELVPQSKTLLHVASLTTGAKGSLVVERRQIKIKFHGDEVVLTEDARGIWSDAQGTWYALRREADSLDDDDRCGIWPFVVPFETPIDDGCTIHDYVYQSPVYQLFHTRQQAEDYLHDLQYKLAEQSKAPWFWRRVSDAMVFLARRFGGFAWENKKTNN